MAGCNPAIAFLHRSRRDLKSRSAEKPRAIIACAQGQSWRRPLARNNFRRHGMIRSRGEIKIEYSTARTFVRSVVDIQSDPPGNRSFDGMTSCHALLPVIFHTDLERCNRAVEIAEIRAQSVDAAEIGIVNASSYI